VTIYGVAIPLYLFLILKKELSLGEFFSLSMVLVALIDLVIGRWIDIKGKSKVIGFGAIISLLVWLARFLTGQVGVLLLLDVLDRITTGMTGIPLSVLTYEKALDGHSTGRALLFREVALSFGSILACLCLILLTLLGIEMKFSFLVAGFFSLLPLLIAKGEK
jgi:MFS family permease